jgi:hypothetical protein
MKNNILPHPTPEFKSIISKYHKQNKLKDRYILDINFSTIEAIRSLKSQTRADMEYDMSEVASSNLIFSNSNRRSSQNVAFEDQSKHQQDKMTMNKLLNVINSDKNIFDEESDYSYRTLSSIHSKDSIWSSKKKKKKFKLKNKKRNKSLIMTEAEVLPLIMDMKRDSLTGTLKSTRRGDNKSTIKTPSTTFITGRGGQPQNSPLENLLVSKIERNIDARNSRSQIVSPLLKKVGKDSQMNYLKNIKSAVENPETKRILNVIQKQSRANRFIKRIENFEKKVLDRSISQRQLFKNYKEEEIELHKKYKYVWKNKFL